MANDPWLQDLFGYVPEATPPPPPKEDSVKQFHLHEWKLYRGFTNTFEYCEVCDEKRQVKL